MSDYTELVKALRCCAENFGCPIECPRYSPADEGVGACVSRLEKDAAAAIEALQAQLPKRGEWVDGDARRVTARCSVCGHLRLGNGAEWVNKHVHFCEVCGSRMGGEKE